MTEAALEKQRAPSIKDAAAFLRDPHHSRDYRRECLEYWRERYGDAFVAQVEATAGRIT